jgi:iron transport multicopper oxidase
VTRAASVTVSFQSTADGRFLGFMNTMSWEPLSGTTTLLSVQKDPTGYAPVGLAVGAGDQLLWTEDSIQVLDLIVVRMLLLAVPVPLSYARAPKDNLDDGDHPFHLHGHRPWVYVHSYIGVFCQPRLLTFSFTTMK